MVCTAPEGDIAPENSLDRTYCWNTSAAFGGKTSKISFYIFSPTESFTLKLLMCLVLVSYDSEHLCRNVTPLAINYIHHFRTIYVVLLGQ